MSYLTSRIVVKNVLDDKDQSVLFNDRLINVSFMHNYLIGITLTTCRVYNIEVIDFRAILNLRILEASLQLT
jgi:hypothetical protein